MLWTSPSRALCCALPAPGTAQVLGGACSLASQNTPFGNTDYLLYMKCVSSVWTAEAIQPGAATQACAAGTAGQIQWTGAALQYCNGSSWVAIGATALAAAGSTGDVQFNTSGALAADTGKLFWDATNHRLGIGTNAPADPLTFGVSPPASSTQALIDLTNGISSGSASGTYIGANPASAGADFILYELGGTGRFFVNKNGSVTLNMPANAAALTIATSGITNISDTFNPVATGATGFGYALTINDGTSSAGGFTGIFENTGVLSAATGTKLLMDLQTNSSSKFTVKATGNVGIGTGSPQATLDVNGYASRQELLAARRLLVDQRRRDRSHECLHVVHLRRRLDKLGPGKRRRNLVLVVGSFDRLTIPRRSQNVSISTIRY